MLSIEENKLAIPPKTNSAYQDFKLIAETASYRVFEAKARKSGERHTIRVLDPTKEFVNKDFDIATSLFMQELLHLQRRCPGAVLVNTLEINTDRQQVACAIHPCGLLSLQLDQVQEFTDLKNPKVIERLLNDVVSDVEFLWRDLHMRNIKAIVKPENIYHLKGKGSFFLGHWDQILEVIAKEPENLISQAFISEGTGLTSQNLAEELKALAFALLKMKKVDLEQLEDFQSKPKTKASYYNSEVQAVVAEGFSDLQEPKELVERLRNLVERMFDRDPKNLPTLDEFKINEDKKIHSMLEKSKADPSPCPILSNSQTEKIEEPPKKIEDPPKKIEEPPRRIEEPAKKIEEPPKKIEKLPKKIEEPPKKIEEPPKRIEEPPKKIEEPPKKIQEPPKKIEKPPEKIEEPPKKIEEPPKKIEKPPEKIEEPPKRIEEPPKRIEEPPKRIEEPPKKIEEPPKKIEKLPKKIEEPPKKIEEPPKRIEEPPKKIEEPPKKIQEPPKKIEEPLKKEEEKHEEQKHQQPQHEESQKHEPKHHPKEHHREHKHDANPLVVGLLAGAEEAVQKLEEIHEAIVEFTEELREKGVGQTQLVIAIDCTASNMYSGKKSFGNKPLHTITPTGLNFYEQVIGVMGSIATEVSPDNSFPVYLFGDKKAKGHSVRPLYTGADGSNECTSVEHVLAEYRKTIPKVELEGPTSFKPVIQRVIELAEATQQFHLLIIIGDGAVTKIQENAEIIQEASNYPILILMVGVGDGDYRVYPENPWKGMEQLDSALTDRKFDNFTFVQYQKDIGAAEFAKSALREFVASYDHCKKEGLII